MASLLVLLEEWILLVWSFLISIGIFWVLKSFWRQQSKWRREYQQRALQNFRYPTESMKFRVLTYNMFLRPPFVKNNQDDFKNERLKEFIGEMNRFDILALQEIFQLGNNRQTTLIEKAKRFGFPFYTRSRRDALWSKRWIDGGLLILSRFPIIARDAFIYYHGHQIDAFAAKQVIYAKIQLNSIRNLHVFTTHMQASYNENHSSTNKINDTARLGQVKEMAAFIRSKIESSHDPVLITGDFNVNARKKQDNSFEESEEYLYLIDEFNKQFMDLQQYVSPVQDLLKLHNRGSHPVTYADVDPKNETSPRETVLTLKHDHCTRECIDYVLFLDSKENAESGILKVVEESTKVEEFFSNHKHFTQLSDHYGISTCLVLSPPTNIV